MNTAPLFGMKIDSLRMTEVVERLLSWCRRPDGRCHYVVTPNVDHAVMFQKHAGLRMAYRDAALVLADGFPVLAAARLLRRNIPERVPGSDLVPALFDAVNQSLLGEKSHPHRSRDEADPAAQGVACRERESGRLRVYLLGAAPGVAERAAGKIVGRWPAVEIAGTYSPPRGFEQDSCENTAILDRIAAAKPDVLIVGLGAPKQELWVHQHRERIAAPVVLCVGATIDFLAGEKPRAPLWMRRIGLEWLHRLASEPRRLAKRYLQDAWVFPKLVWREWKNRERSIAGKSQDADSRLRPLPPLPSAQSLSQV
ncbi:MAG: WecB/TagA/CpsF family glycosyltransferase [Pirellulales bacterium]|nr:WecB/TagA/CpsF family glycosyltransferase [Pirellulales bacterium]